MPLAVPPVLPSTSFCAFVTHFNVAIVPPVDAMFVDATVARIVSPGDSCNTAQFSVTTGEPVVVCAVKLPDLLFRPVCTDALTDNCELPVPTSGVTVNQVGFAILCRFVIFCDIYTHNVTCILSNMPKSV